jgi:hypothetical protein
MSRNDWLVPVDDVLSARLTHYTACGRRADGKCWVDLAMVGPLAVAYALCARCQTSDPQRTRLTALLNDRYAKHESR